MQGKRACYSVYTACVYDHNNKNTRLQEEHTRQTPDWMLTLKIMSKKKV